MDNHMNFFNENSEIIEISEDMLWKARTSIESAGSINVPISKIATLGFGVSSLIPALRTVTHNATINTEGLGLYQLANESVGDTLKIAKNGNFWGAFKTSEGKSKFAQLTNAGPLSTTNKTIMPINPATMLMAVSLFSIEKQLDNIANMQKEILAFLEREKKSEIESDMEMLVNMINKYKFNWDNEQFITNNYKLVLDIQRTALKNMNSYHKKVVELTSSKQLVSVRVQIHTKLNKLKDEFNYYRLSLYTYSLASLLEIMLSGNFKEEYISEIKSELMTLSSTYRQNFNKASICIEKGISTSVETNILKGVGSATKGVGDLIGSIPLVKKGPVDDFLQNGGNKIKENAQQIESTFVHEFASNNNPGVTEITKQMDEMIQIYNHTSKIYFDDNNIYLTA